MAKAKVIQPKLYTNVSRFNPKPAEGLNAKQIKTRNEQHLVNVSNVKTSKSIWSIFSKNIFTFFNMICLAVAIALAIVGAFSDMYYYLLDSYTITTDKLWGEMLESGKLDAEKVNKMKAKERWNTARGTSIPVSSPQASSAGKSAGPKRS